MPRKLTVVTARPDGEIAAVREAAKADASTNWANLEFGGFDPQGTQYGFADLRPTHLGLTNSTYMGEWTHPAMSSGTAKDWIAERTVHEDSYVLIYGIFYNSASPRITEVKPYFGGVDFAWINIVEMFGLLEEKRIFFEHGGWTVGPKQSLRFQAHNNYSTRGTQLPARSEQIGLIGDILAKRSYIIKYDAPTP